MKHRFAAVLFVILTLASSAFARVLSYAPYSNRTSLSGFHERTSRHFVLIESITDTNWWSEQQFVLYDSTGAVEPRVVYPPHGGTALVHTAALYERKTSNGSAQPPMLLVVVNES